MKRSLSVEKPKKRLKIIKNIDDVLKRSKNNIVLFGPVGNGKTSLLNKLQVKVLKLQIEDIHVLEQFNIIIP